jgi:thiamine-phosphate diphosphorylase/hydroxyethylthiazole kinase
VVQLRDKTSDTADLIRIAKEIHAITKARGVPFLINDRVDVAIAIGAEGVHIGQDDIGRLVPFSC